MFRHCEQGLKLLKGERHESSPLLYNFILPSNIENMYSEHKKGRKFAAIAGTYTGTSKG
jgi:hypothetical protein